MSHDNGIIAQIEEWLVSKLTSLTNGSPPASVFKTTDHWRYQVAATEGGIKAYSRYSPFAFVKYQPSQPNRLPFFENQPPKPGREGGYDLRQSLRFAIIVGCSSKTSGDSRIGNSNDLGLSKIRDLIISLLDSSHPGGNLTCDDIYYVGEREFLDSPKNYAIEMFFECLFLGTPT